MYTWSDNRCCSVERDGTRILHSLLAGLYKCTRGCAGVSALKRDRKGKELSSGYGQRSAEVYQPLGASLFLLRFFPQFVEL